MNTVRALPIHIDELSLLPRVCELWREILGQAHIGPDRHFFLAGGDSLQLARLLMRLQTEWGVELPLAQLWQFSTPRLMAQCASDAIVQLHCREPEPAKTWSTVDFPASCSQQGLWFSELNADNRGLYSSALLLGLRGPLVIAVLEQALNTLRWQFPLLQGYLQPDAGGRNLRMVVPPFHSSALQVEPLQCDQADSLASQLLSEPFELGLSLWRCRLYRHTDDWHSLLLCGHHCLIDGWSGAVLLQQLSRAYNALLTDPQWWPDMRDTAFASHCWRQQQVLCSETHADNLLWWQTRLAALAPLPPTLPWQASAQHWPYQLQSRHWLLPQAQLQILLECCAARKQTLFVALLAALASALATVSSHDEHVIAFPVAGRTLAEEENSVGCYMNLLPVRIALHAGELFEQLLPRVQQEVNLVQVHAAPWQSLVKGLRPSVMADGNAWTEVVLALQNFPAAECRFDRLECRSQPLTACLGQHVLKFEASPMPAGLLLRVDYAEAVMSSEVVNQLAMSLFATLQSLHM